MSNLKIPTKKLALLAVFIALSAVIAEYVPGIPIIGILGASIKFDAAIAPIWGLILGPYLGGLAGLIGGVIVASNPFSILTSFSTGASAFVAGSLTQDYFHFGKRRIKGWIIAAFVLGLLIIGWYITPIGMGAPFYPLLQFLGLLIILSIRGKTASWFKDIEKKKFFLSIIFASYVGIISDHMVGNLAFIGLIGTFFDIPWKEVPSIFMTVLPISAIERAVLTAIASFLGISLIVTLKRSGLFVRSEEII